MITGGIGVCHTYVDADVDFDKALTVIENAKIQRPSACNSLETLLVNRSIAAEFLPALSAKMAAAGVTLHAAENALPLLQGGPATVVPVNAEDYDDEWLSLDLNVLLVDDINQAIDHIRTHGTNHSSPARCSCAPSTSARGGLLGGVVKPAPARPRPEGNWTR